MRASAKSCWMATFPTLTHHLQICHMCFAVLPTWKLCILNCFSSLKWISQHCWKSVSWSILCPLLEIIPLLWILLLPAGDMLLCHAFQSRKIVESVRVSPAAGLASPEKSAHLLGAQHSFVKPNLSDPVGGPHQVDKTASHGVGCKSCNQQKLDLSDIKTSKNSYVRLQGMFSRAYLSRQIEDLNYG